MLFLEDVSIPSFFIPAMTCVVVVVLKKFKCQSYELYKHIFIVLDEKYILKHLYDVLKSIFSYTNKK